MDNLAGRILASRNKVHMTQEGFCKAISVSKRTLINYEQGISEPTVSTLNLISSVTDVDIKWLASGKNETENKSNETFFYFYHCKVFFQDNKIEEVSDICSIINTSNTPSNIFNEFYQSIENQIIDRFDKIIDKIIITTINQIMRK